MKVRRRFLIALMASLLLHASIVTAPGWLPPSLDDFLHPKPAQRIDAWLKRPARQLASAPSPAKPRRPRPPKPTPSPNAVVVPNMPVPEPVVPDAAPTPEPVPPQAVAPVAPPSEAAPAEAATNGELLSLHVRIQYSVTMGGRGFVIGRAVQELDNDGTAYRLHTATGTTGLARLFKPVDVAYTSLGDIVEGRLRPRLFTVERAGEPAANALFDWNRAEVQVDERRLPLEPGTQDMLSVFCQLALVPIVGDSVTLPVVTSKKVEHYEFSVIGQETLATPMGDQPTLHLRTVGREPQVTDVWLVLNFARLPVRIRHVDRDGEVFDQVIAGIETVPTMEAPH